MQIKNNLNIKENPGQNNADFLKAAEMSAQILGRKALARGCFQVYHICKLLEQATHQDQAYIPYSCEEAQ